MSEENRQLRVFLCHASQDKPAVRELYSALKIEGWIDPWLDKAKILPGQDWRTVIEKAVEESDVVIVCLSTQSVSKEGFVQREIKYAYDIALEKPEETIFLIPMRLDDCVVPRGLRSFHWVNYFGVEKSDAYSDLLDALKLRYEQKLRIEDELARREKERQARESVEKAAREKAEREAADRAAREKAERESAEKAARAKAIHEAAEKAERVKAEKLERETAEKAARVKTEQEVEKHNSQIEKKPVLQNENSVPKLFPQTKNVSSTSLRNTFIWIGVFGLACIGGICAWIVWPQLALNRPDNSSTIPTKTFSVAASVQALPSETLAPSPLPIDTLSPTATPYPLEIKDKYGVPMVFVPMGDFVMGSDIDEAKDNPEYTISLDDFYIDKFEVTNFFYKICVQADGCKEQPPEPFSSPIYYNNSQYDNYPVLNVNWKMAEDYCFWRSAHLPTEMEWEKAARGKDGLTYPWGENIDETFANYNTTFPTVVGAYEKGRSPYSAYDMAGNAWEWVEDWYDAYAWGDPNASKDFGQVYKVLRGGMWAYFDLSLGNHSPEIDKVRAAYNVRSANRLPYDPSLSLPFFGFRCAKDATP